MIDSCSRRACLALSSVAAAAWCLFSALPGRADVIELKTGQKIEGDVLKDAGGELVIDLGVDIVRIPVSQIKTRQARGDAVKEDSEARSDKHEIYATPELPVRTIKELTMKFAEGVVLVQHPSG